MVGKKIIVTSLYLLMVGGISACKTADPDPSPSTVMVASSDDKPSCQATRKKPFVALSLWEPTIINGQQCDPGFSTRFLPEIKKHLKPSVIHYWQFKEHYPSGKTGSWFEQQIATVMDAAVASSPGCPMIVFNLSCFDPERSFKYGCGKDLPAKDNTCVTAQEMNRILSDPKLFAATLWYEEKNSVYQKLTPEQVQVKFGKYFPQHWE